MSEKKAKYVTTTLPYVNASPHMGHGLEFVQADALARYWRLLGNEVFFSTGTDEHGQKIAEKADEAGVSRQAYVDKYAEEFNKLKEALDLSHDNFIRTTDEHHLKAAQEIWKRCSDSGDIYKKSYVGLYCVGCEAYYRETELDENKCCKIHGKPVEEVEEENYFFKLSEYEDKLLEFFADEKSILPDWQRQWVIDFVKEGLDDLSISRQKDRMDWGVPVPGDDEHVMYVWFDALTNYISTLGWPNEDGDFKKFWVEGDTLQMAGKDQPRFQSIIWGAMLMSAGLQPPDTIFYHGFINSGGQKMSKSIGNVISPYELVEKYGTDATRYILLRHVHPTEDSDLTWEKMDGYYTDNLVNGLGNLTARIMKMSETHLDSPLDEESITDEQWAEIYSEFYTEPFDKFSFQEVMNNVWTGIQRLDEFITETEPFKLIKSDPEAGKANIKSLREGLYTIGKRLEPLMPDTSEIILEAVKTNKKPENLFGRLDS